MNNIELFFVLVVMVILTAALVIAINQRNKALDEIEILLEKMPGEK